MSMLIKNLENNRKVIFDQGRFDLWCVYVVEAEGSRIPPRDANYFEDLKQIAQSYPNNKVYEDFVRIYNQTTSVIDENVLTLIDEIVDTYSSVHHSMIEQLFTIIYGGMIAEENKANSILKKRIKRLGIYQVLILNMSSNETARFSFGKKWKKLDAIMKQYGF